ncbi:MAG: M16 family metallopeptidase, partial [Candidatus Rokuibacteriota bacterium]
MTARRLVAALALAVLAGGVAAAQPAAPEVSAHVLPNGVRVLIREEASAGVVAVSLQVLGGARLETAATSGITNFLHRAMLRGTARRTGEQLVEAAERLGGTVEASGDADHAEVRGAALARHWEDLLGLVAEVALRPTLPAEEVERERRLILGQIQTRADTPFRLAFDTLLAELYGPHPYARPSGGRRQSVAGITREGLASHHRALYRADRIVLAVSGRLERDRVRRAVERLFGEAPAAGPGQA